MGSAAYRLSSQLIREVVRRVHHRACTTDRPRGRDLHLLCRRRALWPGLALGAGRLFAVADALRASGMERGRDRGRRRALPHPAGVPVLTRCQNTARYFSSDMIPMTITITRTICLVR